LFFGIPSFFFFVKLYLSGKKHGGDEAYIAPVLLTIPEPVPASLAGINSLRARSGAPASLGIGNHILNP